MASETPQISTTSYVTNAYNPLQDINSNFHGTVFSSTDDLPPEKLHQLTQLKQFTATRTLGGTPQALQPTLKEQVMAVTKRMVQVYIVDPNEHVPVTDSTIYKDAAPYLTELTDQELFYEIPIKQLLDDHNKKRVTFINKAVKDRTEHLEPAKIRDLKMVVTEIAKF